MRGYKQPRLFSLNLRHPEGGARIPEEPEEEEPLPLMTAARRLPAAGAAPESAKTGEGLENRRLKKLFSSQWMEEAPSRFLRVRFIAPLRASVNACSIHPMPHRPRRGTRAPGAQQDEPPGDARRVQPLRGTDEPFADARGPAGDVIQKKRHVRADAGGQPDELRQGQRFGRGRSAIQAAPPRAALPPPSPAPCGMPFSSTASTPGRKPEASANRR